MSVVLSTFGVFVSCENERETETERPRNEKGNFVGDQQYQRPPSWAKSGATKKKKTNSGGQTDASCNDHNVYGGSNRRLQRVFTNGYGHTHIKTDGQTLLCRCENASNRRKKFDEEKKPPINGFRHCVIYDIDALVLRGHYVHNCLLVYHSCRGCTKIVVN